MLATKVYRTWDWALIEQLLDGPLRTPSRFERVLRREPRWVKRQLSMLRPEKDCFTQERRDDTLSLIIARISCKV